MGKKQKLYMEMEPIGLMFDAEGHPSFMVVFENSRKHGDTFYDPVPVTQKGENGLFSDVNIGATNILNRVFLPVIINGESGQVLDENGKQRFRPFRFKNGEAFTKSDTGQREYRIGAVVDELTKRNLLAMDETLTDNERCVSDFISILAEYLEDDTGSSNGTSHGWSEASNDIFDAFKGKFSSTIVKSIEMAGHGTNEGTISFAKDPGAAELIKLIKIKAGDAASELNNGDLSSNEEWEFIKHTFCEEIVQHVLGNPNHTATPSYGG